MKIDKVNSATICVMMLSKYEETIEESLDLVAKMLDLSKDQKTQVLKNVKDSL